MIRRKIAELVQKRLKKYPAVGLLGPRQCGKTTLAQALNGNYFDLEAEPDRLKLDLQWPKISVQNKLVVLDEAQTWPDIFLKLRSAIDRERKRNGRFLILGSVSPSLTKQVAESLTGRISPVELTPFLLNELPDKTIDQLWLLGGFPDGGILDLDRYPQWQLDYIALLTQRDLPNWGLTAKPQVTQRLLRMIAAVNGQIWNASQIGRSLGLNYQTINTYLDYLIGVFLMYRLEPFAPNLRKRLVKSPKIYWRDSGLLHAILQITDMDSLLAQPWVGTSWEGFVIGQILGRLYAKGKIFQPYFLRTSDQYEIDLILDFGSSLWAVEIKLTSSPSTGDIKYFNNAADMIKADKRILISRTPETIESENFISTNLPDLLRIL